MPYSKLLPSFTFEVLCFLNRDQLERFSIVCRPLKNLIDRYFRSKPYRVFDEFHIRWGSYALVHNNVRWHPNREDYSVQQFLAGQKYNDAFEYYSFGEMLPYFAPTVRIKWIYIYAARDSIYNPDHIAEMESIAYLWRDGHIGIRHAGYSSRIVAEDFQSILNSPTILQCQNLYMDNALFSFKDYKVLYTVKVIETWYGNNYFDPNCWLEFLEQPGVKPILIFRGLDRDNVVTLLDRLFKVFSSDVSPNAFKIVFSRRNYSMTEFRETNKTSREKLELKKGLPVEYQKEYLKERSYTLERASI
ncbi:hypothetical protein Ddc_20286 [Ditylenchus destructor]|nr:hypothetical protein Ddc_20286 [Ditylenchus destructor]